MEDTTAIELHQTTDAVVWAKEFKRLFPHLVVEPEDEANMVAWFANAIEVGRSAGYRECANRVSMLAK
jgi:hypothetical protein